MGFVHLIKHKFLMSTIIISELFQNGSRPLRKLKQIRSKCVFGTLSS